MIKRDVKAPKKGRAALRDLVLFATLGAATFAAKMAMAALPNIEPVSLMVMLFAVTFGRRAFYPIAVYVSLEFLTFGLNIWSVCYLYVWAVLAVAAWALRRMRSALGWALLSGTFGLFFGLLCALTEVFIGGWAFAFSWWVSGIPFDLLHGAGNFVIALTLFNPLRRLTERLRSPDAGGNLPGKPGGTYESSPETNSDTGGADASGSAPDGLRGEETGSDAGTDSNSGTGHGSHTESES